jgi:integrase/recombinase XerC/integrase/recombinase XerD
VARGVKGAKVAKGFRKDTFSVSQLHQLLNSVDKTSLQGQRDFALLNLLIRTGLRTIEVLRANVGDLRQEGGETVLIVQGKGRDSKDDFVLLTEETLAPIREYLTARDARADEPLFTSHSTRNSGTRLATRSMRGIVKRYLRKCNLDSERLSAHSFRHTAITLALMAGASIQEAQALARHSQITSTMVYAQNLNRIASAPERKIASLLAYPN